MLSGLVEISGNVAPEYLHQYYLTVNTNGASQGTANPNSGWFNASSLVGISATPALGFAFSKWTVNNPFVTLSNPNTVTASAIVNGAGTVTAQFIPGVTATLSSTSGSVARRHSITITLKLSGSPQTVTLSHTVVRGISVKFAKNPVQNSLSGVSDSVTISISSTMRLGTYHTVITATGTDGQTSSVTFTVTVT